MVKIIAFASSKGGTGKTTVIANVGTALAKYGKRVLLIDADITMANLALVLGLEKKKITLHEVLAGEAKLQDAIYKCQGGVFVIPSGVSLNSLKKARLDKMNNIINKLSGKFDIILIDAPSGLERDVVIALKMGQKSIIVTTPDIASLSNAFRTKIVAESLGVKPIGVVVTRTTSEEVDLSNEEVGFVLELPVLATIPEDPEVRRSVALGEPVVIRNPKSPAALQFKRFVSILLES